MPQGICAANVDLPKLFTADVSVGLDLRKGRNLEDVVGLQVAKPESERAQLTALPPL
jgi:hypothetical protein